MNNALANFKPARRIFHYRVSKWVLLDVRFRCQNKPL
jgi:hypothetical protein